MFHCKVDVGQGLRFNALSRVDDKECAFTGSESSGDLVVEVDMARGVNKVQDVIIAVFGMVIKLDGLILDGDAPLPFKGHIVKDLVFHFPLGKGPCLFDEAVSKRGFSMIDMGNDGKIPDSMGLWHGLILPPRFQ